MQAKIKAAIAESQYRDHSVSLELPLGDISDAIVEIGAAWHGDVDYAAENDGSYDVWGSLDETPDVQEWRLSVTLQPYSE